MNNLKIQLEPRSITSCPEPDVPEDIQKAFKYGMLQHQVDVYQAAETHDIILDLAPTGTGKTNAGLSVLGHNRHSNAIYIAPTNALITQQAEAAKEFVQAVGLPHVVKSASAKEVRGWTNEPVGPRSGEKIYNVLREPGTIFPECAGKPLLLVTNPDIFYYAAFFQYGPKDRSNIASVFYNSFSTIIFDEFHLYDAKQLVSLLFYLALSKVFGYFEHNRKIVLLTATPEPACEAALALLGQEGVRVKSVEDKNTGNNQLPSQTAVDLELRPYPDKETVITEITTEVMNRLQRHPDKNGAVILDSKDTIGRITNILGDSVYKNDCGRITGDIPPEQRYTNAQKKVILATSTVDVGFNFEREIPPARQNLDWLIFSARDRFSFWQCIGRVGRVLGKQITDISSDAISYLPEQAWEQGIESLNSNGGRSSLKQELNELDCLKRPFLEIYWRSEAFLEIARPLLELEISFKQLSEEKLIQDLYATLQRVFKGSRPWKYYKGRMQLIAISEKLEKAPITPTKKGQWSFIKVLFEQSPCIRQSLIRKFLELNYPEQFEKLGQEFSINDIEGEIKDHEDLASELKSFCVFWKTVWSPLFRFRDSLFSNLTVYDPYNFLLDQIGETDLDPFHLLRFYEFADDNARVELTERVKSPYKLSFNLQRDSIENFEATQLCKLWAYEDLSISRTLGDSVRPTQMPSSLERELKEMMIPGVVVKKGTENRWAIVKLNRQGLESYPLFVSDFIQAKPREYLFFPSLSGILAIATAGVRLQTPDSEEFWIT